MRKRIPMALFLLVLGAVVQSRCGGGTGGKCRYDTDCPGTEVCRDGSCVLPDRCPEVPCPSGEFCVQGTCYPQDCPTHFCPGTGEVCVDDECVQGSCVGVECPQGQACAGGLCYPTDCGGTTCAPDQVCIEDQCVQRSCAGVSCGPGQRCKDGLCIGTGLPGQYLITSGGARLQLTGHRAELFVSPMTLVGNTSSTNFKIRLGPGAVLDLYR